MPRCCTPSVSPPATSTPHCADRHGASVLCRRSSASYVRPCGYTRGTAWAGAKVRGVRRGQAGPAMTDRADPSAAAGPEAVAGSVEVTDSVAVAGSADTARSVAVAGSVGTASSVGVMGSAGTAGSVGVTGSAGTAGSARSPVVPVRRAASRSPVAPAPRAASRSPAVCSRSSVSASATAWQPSRGFAAVAASAASVASTARAASVASVVSACVAPWANATSELRCERWSARSIRRDNDHRTLGIRPGPPAGPARPDRGGDRRELGHRARDGPARTGARRRGDPDRPRPGPSPRRGRRGRRQEHRGLRPQRPAPPRAVLHGAAGADRPHPGDRARTRRWRTSTSTPQAVTSRSA